MTPEEEAMQEKLKNMSPQELKEYQKQNCVFCQIIEGKVASKKVFEDDNCIAILDINPANPGHLLLMPKEHYAIMPLMPDTLIKHMFMISKQLSGALLRALKADGTNIFVANGAAAGQKAQHFMVHVIPRMKNDGISLDITGKKANDKELLDLQKLLVAKLNNKPSADIEYQQELASKRDDKIKSKLEGNKEIDENANLDDVSNLFTGRPANEQNANIVDAEFTEENNDSKQKKNKMKKTKKKKEKEQVEKDSDDDNISLDDIASLVGGKS